MQPTPKGIKLGHRGNKQSEPWKADTHKMVGHKMIALIIIFRLLLFSHVEPESLGSNSLEYEVLPE